MNQQEDNNRAQPHVIPFEVEFGGEYPQREREQERDGEEQGEVEQHEVLVEQHEEEGAEEQQQEEEEEEEESSGSSVYSSPPELQMSAQEEAWVSNLVKWMEKEDPNCIATARQIGASEVPSDFEYSLHAIISQGNEEKGAQSIRSMQKFRQKYNIQDTVEEGVQAFQDYIELQPGFLVHVDAMGSQGTLVVVDISKSFPNRVRTSSNNLRKFMMFHYYLCQALAPNFDVLRGGTINLVEASGMCYRNIDAVLDQQLLQELLVHIPLKHNQLRIYNNTDLLASFLGLLKRFMPEKMKDAVKVGCRLESSRIKDPTGSPVLNGILNAVLPAPPRLTLPDFFLQPSYDVAMQNLMTKVRMLLEERYRNEELFELYSQVPPPQA